MTIREKIRRDGFKKWIAKLLLIKVPLAFIAVTVLWVFMLKWIPVWVTPLMVSRSIEYRNDDGFRTQKKWRSYEKISPEMAKSVIASEDNLFVEHNGFDWKEMKKAIKEHKEKGKRLRGASTISQQTAKNVFLFPSRSFVRKVFEAYFTLLIEWIWGKERILEVYLNVAEMGKGIYGAEAAISPVLLPCWKTWASAVLCSPAPPPPKPSAPSALSCKAAGSSLPSAPMH